MATLFTHSAYPRHALAVGQANGMVGYVPHRKAFLRGGYETTLCGNKRFAPEVGNLLADGAMELIAERLGRKNDITIPIPRPRLYLR